MLHPNFPRVVPVSCALCARWVGDHMALIQVEAPESAAWRAGAQSQVLLRPVQRSTVTVRRLGSSFIYGPRDLTKPLH